MLGQLFAQWYLYIAGSLFVAVVWLWWLGQRPDRAPTFDLRWKLLVVALTGGGGIGWLESLARHTLAETPPEYREVELESILTWAPMIASTTIAVIAVMAVWGTLRKEPRTHP